MEYARTLFVLWVFFFTEKVLWEVDYFFAHLAEYQMHIKGSKKTTQTFCNFSNSLVLCSVRWRTGVQQFLTNDGVVLCCFMLCCVLYDVASSVL